MCLSLDEWKLDALKKVTFVTKVKKGTGRYCEKEEDIRKPKILKQFSTLEIAVLGYNGAHQCR